MTERPRDIRLVIADDHPIFRHGLRKLLEGEPGFAIVGEAHNGEDAVRLVRDRRPDVLLLDLAMPGTGGMEALRAVADTPTRVIILTACIREAEVVQAIQLGARGIVLKESATRHLIEGIRHVLEGRAVIGDGAVEDLVEVIRRSGAPPTKRPYGLTPREREILGAIAAGQSNREIADRFGISVQTVKHHLTSIFDKTGVSSRLELALFAVRQRLVDED